MSARRVTLEILEVADPCGEDWNAMRGDERVRFCGLCHQNVFNLSAMDREEAERLVAEAEGRVCVRFYRRADGTVSTADCAPERMAVLRRTARRGMAVAAGALAGLCALVGGIGVATAAGAAAWLAEMAEDEPCELPVMGAMPVEQPFEPEVVVDPIEDGAAEDGAAEDGATEDEGQTDSPAEPSEGDRR